MHDLESLDAPQLAWQEALKVLTGANQATRFAKYRDDPVAFGREVLGATYWAAQVSILNALATHKRVTVRGPRKSSKTHTASHAVLWFMATAPSRVITIGPSERQVKEQLWARIGSEKLAAREELPGVCNVVEWTVAPDWKAIGMSTDKPGNVRGFHSDIDPALLVAGEVKRLTSQKPQRRLLIIVDEANAIAQPIFDALRGSLQGDNTYLLLQANPTLAADSPHFYAKSHQPGSGFHRIHISAEKIEQDEVGSEELFDSVPEVLISPKWIGEMRRDCGHDYMKSPIYLADVRGQFSSGAIDWQIVTRPMLDAMATLELCDDGRPESRHIGVDVAREGGDNNVAVLWVGGALAAIHNWKTRNDPSSLMTTAGIIAQLIHTWGPAGRQIPARNVHIDVGMGAGVIDRLRQTGFYVDGVDFGGGAKYDHKRLTGQALFQNRKSELFWVMRRYLEEGEASIPRKYERVWQQLQWHRYKLVEKAGGTQIGMRDHKEELKTRYGESPDYADAAVIGWSRVSASPPSFRVL